MRNGIRSCEIYSTAKWALRSHENPAARIRADCFGGLGQTQGQMNIPAFEDFQTQDRLLNSTYAEIAHGLDGAGRAKLKTAEQAWIAYRDAEASFEADVVARGGTLAPLIYNETRAHLTSLRIKELKKSASLE
jgi:uncharacterized protein YecT (DUF1311 family)